MDESQVRALLLELTAGLASKEEVNQTVNQAVSGFAAKQTRLTQALEEKLSSLASPTPELDKEEGATNEESAEFKRLKAEVEAMKNKVSEAESRELEASRNGAYSDALNSVDAINREALATLFRTRYPLQNEGGKWFVMGENETPQTPHEALQQYLATDEGKLFKPASPVQSGGTSESKNSAPNSAKPTTLAGMLAEIKEGKASLAV
jgi:hypothetical protein